MTMDQALADMLDRDAIRRIMERYFRGTDRHYLAMVENCYWPEAQGEFGRWRGRVVELPAIAAKMLKSLYANTSHLLGQCHIDLRGDKAVSETYAIAAHHLPDKGPGKAMTDIMWCRYVDRLEKRNGEWRIAHRQFIVDQILRAADAETAAMNVADFMRGVPGPEDASCDAFGG
jgi:hypothetical protein